MITLLFRCANRGYDRGSFSAVHKGEQDRREQDQEPQGAQLRQVVAQREMVDLCMRWNTNCGTA
ncbi:MAG TPA: hypothetical protein VE225_02535 [Rubrobacteraceae bacterium]|nr:hypothetical protein [Rubrobacteraceae bacterium]